MDTEPNNLTYAEKRYYIIEILGYTTIKLYLVDSHAKYIHE